ncbi:MAG: phosphate-starvation-inducible PsiE family protein [Patescibacteria group bacterium]
MAKRINIPKLNRTQFTVARSLLNKSISFLLFFLIFVILLGFFGGIVKTLWDLRLLLSLNVEESLRQLLLNAIALLAVVEIIKTTLSYLTDGRVRVTYIVDTVLIVMLNEVISFWFTGANFQQEILLMVTILTLIFVRLLAIRFSPDD